MHKRKSGNSNLIVPILGCPTYFADAASEMKTLLPRLAVELH